MSDALAEDESERRKEIEALFSDPGAALVEPSAEVRSEERERELSALADWYLDTKRARDRGEALLMAQNHLNRVETE